MTYKYVSVGMSLGGTSGIVTYFHDRCASKLNATLGPKAIIFEGEVPLNAKCPWCGKSVNGTDNLTFNRKG